MFFLNTLQNLQWRARGTSWLQEAVNKVEEPHRLTSSIKPWTKGIPVFWKNSVLMWEDSSTVGHFTNSGCKFAKIWETVFTTLQQVLWLIRLCDCVPIVLWKLFVLKKSRKIQIFWIGVRKTTLFLSEDASTGAARSTRNFTPFLENPNRVL